MIWENGIETCKLSYVKQIASPGSMHETGCLGLVHWDDQWDGMGREVGEGYRMESTCTAMADSSQCMAKPIQYCNVKLKEKKNRCNVGSVEDLSNNCWE